MTLLEIVIPTRNRERTLVPSVRAILAALGDRNYRIAIADNSDVALDRSIQEEFAASGRVVYRHNPHTVDVIENFNSALAQADGKYVTLIGDDDFVLPEIFNAIEILESEKLDCLIHPRPAYYWPDVTFDREFDFFRPATLLIGETMSDRIEQLEPASELDRVRAAGAIYLYNLPALYHALLRSDALHRIKQTFGDYVLGPSPDMSLAVALCALDVRYARSSIPFSVAGASYNSAAGMGRRGAHTAALDRAPSWLPISMKEQWDPRLPEVWNGYSVYAQSLISVARVAGLDTDLNLPKLFKKMIAEDLSDMPHVRQKLSSLGLRQGLGVIVLGTAEGVLRRLLTRLPAAVLNRLIRRRPHFRGLHQYGGILSPQACIACAEAHIAARRPA